MSKEIKEVLFCKDMIVQSMNLMEFLLFNEEQPHRFLRKLGIMMHFHDKHLKNCNECKVIND